MSILTELPEDRDYDSHDSSRDEFMEIFCRRCEHWTTNQTESPCSECVPSEFKEKDGAS